ncbi:ATP-binding cassette domain-containing protein [Streptomyces sp. 6N223]|uniref:ATP-binding cassette domain-containing protein n=1 Tax=Streptomyces sp. 6N223 TaxID=3457412 RepID=UPI003FD50D1E
MTTLSPLAGTTDEPGAAEGGGGRSGWRALLPSWSPKLGVGLFLVLGITLFGVLGPMFASDPDAINSIGMTEPSGDHLLGTTQTGQDVLAQLAHSTRGSLQVGLLVGVLATALSAVFGIIGGYLGGLVDESFSLFSNVMLVIPGLPLVIVIAGFVPAEDRGWWTVALVLAITGWAASARVLRAQTLSLRNRDYVAAARVAGEKPWRIVAVEILPNLLPLLASQFVFAVIAAILSEAGLSFLGLGASNSHTLGTMLYFAQNGFALQYEAWWWFGPPGLVIALFGCGLALINFAIDEIINPKLRVQKRRRSARNGAVAPAVAAAKTPAPEAGTAAAAPGGEQAPQPGAPTRGEAVTDSAITQDAAASRDGDAASPAGSATASAARAQEGRASAAVRGGGAEADGDAAPGEQRARGDAAPEASATASATDGRTPLSAAVRAADAPPAGGRGAAQRDAVLTVTGLDVVYQTESPVHAVKDVSFTLGRGEILGLAGESGCGKTTLAYAVNRLHRPPAEVTAGSVVFHDRSGTDIDLLGLRREELRRFRWDKLSMVFQGAMNSLNPVISIHEQLDDVLTTHRPTMPRDERRQRCEEVLRLVGVDPVRLKSFPHELSGGMRQRVMIAMAMLLDPQVMIMDEPTTALDVVVQRGILREIIRLRDELGFAVIFITHDLPLLLELSDTIAVMREGQIVEYAPAAEIYARPRHPYTRQLLGSFPSLTGERGAFVRTGTEIVTKKTATEGAAR